MRRLIYLVVTLLLCTELLAQAVTEEETVIVTDEFLDSNDTCLHCPIRERQVVAEPKCGNNILEVGEECEPPGEGCCERGCKWRQLGTRCRCRVEGRRRRLRGRCDENHTCICPA